MKPSALNKLNTLDAILDFAIQEEEKAALFYADLKKQAKSAGMKQAFKEFVKEELKHKKKLEKIKKGKPLKTKSRAAKDLKIADYLVDVEPTDSLSYQDALIIAMKKEKLAFKMYSDLAAALDNNWVQGVLLGLAQEEAKHKLKFEIEYEKYFLQEN